MSELENHVRRLFEGEDKQDWAPFEDLLDDNDFTITRASGAVSGKAQMRREVEGGASRSRQAFDFDEKTYGGCGVVRCLLATEEERNGRKLHKQFRNVFVF